MVRFKSAIAFTTQLTLCLFLPWRTWRFVLKMRSLLSQCQYLNLIIHY
ncbi:hypothetical protein [Calothrix sp. NIES-2098]